MTSRKSKIAYLNSRYSAISHTFIHREVRTLREMGVEVSTISIRKPENSDLNSEDAIRESAKTTVLLKSLSSLLGDALIQTLKNPLRAVRGFWQSQKLSPSGINQMTLHLAYFLEALKLVRYLQKEEISHIHVHMANNAASVAFIAQHLDPSLKYSLSIHGPAEFINIENGRLAKKIEAAQFVRCISEFCRSQIMSVAGIEQWDKLKVVHCGVETVPAPSVSVRPRNKFLFVGRLVPEKGAFVLLKSLESLCEKYPDWILEIGGDGPIRQELERYVSQSLLKTRVHFLGALPASKVLEKMSDCDVFVLPSFMEGVPVVLMEAMVRAKWVVSTRIAGIPELIEDGQNGFLVSPGSVSELKTCLEVILNQPKNFLKMGANAREKVEQHFNLEKETKKLLQLFIESNALKIDSNETNGILNERRAS